VVSVLPGFFWDRQISVLGFEHSVALLVLCFFAGCVGCASVVIFYPFASSFSSLLIASMAAGSGSNALFASAIAAIQQPGASDQHFSPNVFFFALSAFFVLSLSCLLVIHSSKYSSAFQRESTVTAETSSVSMSSQLWQLKWLLLNQFFICTLNYASIGLFPYAFKGFGSSSTLLRWNNILSASLGAISRLFSGLLFFPHVGLLTILQMPLWMFVGAFCIGIVDKSLQPLFIGWILVAANCLYSTIYGYADTTIFLCVTKPPFSQQLNKAASSRLVGAANQLGAFVGSFLSFLLLEILLVRHNSLARRSRIPHHGRV